MSYAKPTGTKRKLIGIASVIVIHVLVIYALINGLARKIVEVIQPPLETKIIMEAKMEDKSPTPPPPHIVVLSPPYVPLPEVPVQLPPVEPQNTIVAVSITPTPVQHYVQQAAIANANDCDKPEYPAASLQAGEAGVVRLQFLIGIDGKVLESKIIRTSGYRRLDEVARKALELCKFKPAMVDGRPEQSWASLEYAWTLEE